MSRHSFPVFVIYSLLIHLLFMSFFAVGWIRVDKPLPKEPERTTLTLMEMRKSPEQASITERPKPPGHEFIPTVDAQATTKANPNAPLESDHNTKLTSVSPARNTSSPLPDLRGDPRVGLSYANIPGSTAREEAQPAPPTKQQTPQQKPPEPEQQQTAPTPKQPTPPPKTVAQNNTSSQPTRFSLEPPEQRLQPRPDQQRPTTQAQSEPEQSPQAPRPPPTAPSTFSLSKSRSEVQGGGSPGMLPSPEARETELGRYKSKIYRAIGSRWYLNVEIAKADLAIGMIKVRFYIQANGVVRNVDVVEDSGAQMLRTISIRAIVDSAPFEPFSESLKSQLGDGYQEEFTFSIY